MHEIRHLSASTLMTRQADNADIRILRRVSSLDNLPLVPRGNGPFRKIVVLDTEITGTDAPMDEIIDIAVGSTECRKRSARLA